MGPNLRILTWKRDDAMCYVKSYRIKRVRLHEIPTLTGKSNLSNIKTSKIIIDWKVKWA